MTKGILGRPPAPRAVREQMFWARVDRRGSDECWPWLGPLFPLGYGRFWLKPNRSAHRAAYVLLVGPIPEGLELDHLCHTVDATCSGGNTCPHRRCVNPAHMEPVTHVENVRRGMSGDYLRAKTQCVNGHPFDAANTIVNPVNGYRVCRACKQDSGRATDARRRAAHGRSAP